MSNLSSGRPCALKTSHYLKQRQSNSPTLSSSKSQKSLWARSYKNQPIPAQLRKRLIGKKYQFEDSQQQDEQIMAVLEQEEQQQIQQSSKLPKIKVISDWGQFSQVRKHRLNSDSRSNQGYMRLGHRQRCHSTASLKLPQVLQEKKQDDDKKQKGLTKIAEFKDNNQFGLISHRVSSCHDSDNASKTESLEIVTHLNSILPQQIEENQAEQTRSERLPLTLTKNYKLDAQMDKIVVDQLDDKKKKKKQEVQDEPFSVIEEEKADQTVNTDKLSQLLSKFQDQSNYLKKIDDQTSYSNKNLQNQGYIEQIKQKDQ